MPTNTGLEEADAVQALQQVVRQAVSTLDFLRLEALVERLPTLSDSEVETLDAWLTAQDRSWARRVQRSVAFVFRGSLAQALHRRLAIETAALAIVRSFRRAQAQPRAAPVEGEWLYGKVFAPSVFVLDDDVFRALVRSGAFGFHLPETPDVQIEGLMTNPGASMPSAQTLRHARLAVASYDHAKYRRIAAMGGMWDALIQHTAAFPLGILISKSLAEQPERVEQAIAHELIHRAIVQLQDEERARLDQAYAIVSQTREFRRHAFIQHLRRSYTALNREFWVQSVRPSAIMARRYEDLEWRRQTYQAVLDSFIEMLQRWVDTIPEVREAYAIVRAMDREAEAIAQQVAAEILQQVTEDSRSAGLEETPTVEENLQTVAREERTHLVQY